MPLKSPSRQKSGHPGHIRIIAGKWRSRKFSVLDSEGLRPTSDRLRETLFNWLAPVIPDSICLDLFAGSGALGFESLSRGARECYFLEQNPVAFNQLRHSCNGLQATEAHLVKTDSLAWLQQEQAHLRFDIVFLDPPFAANLLNQCAGLLETRGWLSRDACIYLEAGRSQDFQPPGNWRLYKEKRTGNVSARLYRRQIPD